MMLLYCARQKNVCDCVQIFCVMKVNKVSCDSDSFSDFNLLHPTLQEENLDGENRYFCESCQGKQSATRRIKLNSLPPTLNLQLMRFIFDRSADILCYKVLIGL